jgi:transcriptional regulator with XRE-family HTH domain
LNIKLETIFARILKENRQQQEQSQEEIALTANLDRTYISMLESGKRQPTLTTIFALCKALNIRPTDVIREIEKETKFESTDVESYIQSVNPKPKRSGN